MAGFQIYLQHALSIYNQTGTNEEYFSIGYRRQDGTYGFKEKVKRRAGTGIENLKTETNTKKQAGQLKLIDEAGNKFQIWVCLWHSINGKIIDKRF